MLTQLIYVLLKICFITISLRVTFVVALPKNSVSRDRQECLTSGCVHAASSILKNMNASVNPCNDFYQFACGGFLERTHIAGDKSYVTSYTKLQDQLDDKLRTIVEQPIRRTDLKSFFFLKLLYRTCMNRTGIEKKGLTTVKKMLLDLGGWPVLRSSEWDEEKFDWKEAIYGLRKWGLTPNYILSVNTGIDPKNSTKRVITVDQASLGLTRKYLLKGLKQNVVEAYYNYMVKVAEIFGANRATAEKELKESLEFEISLANISLPQEKRRNATDLYHPMTIKELQLQYSSIPWRNYISKVLNTQVDDDEVVVVKVPQYFSDLEKLLQKTPVRIQANHIMWRGVKNSIPYLTKALANEKLEFDKVLKGITERKHRSKECISIVAEKMELAIGALYARKYFSQSARKKVMDIISDLQYVFSKILKEIDWMDETTKQNAFEKFAAMSVYVGYSDELYDDKEIDKYYSKLEIRRFDDYFLAAMNVSLFNKYKATERLRQPVNKTDWTTRASPAVVNAYYHPSENSIQFPAGILQGVYFENNRPSYVNYGGIGYVIGHEITHGFDDRGRQFDKDGNVVDWWAKKTSQAFSEKAQCIIDQYSNITVPSIDLNLNGIITQGENIADNGGIKEAYLAYQAFTERNRPEQKLPGLDLTPNQLFWISAANVWCAKSRPEFLKLMVLTNSHAPDEFRIKVPFGNVGYFAKDFNCPLGSKMNPVHKCQVW